MNPINSQKMHLLLINMVEKIKIRRKLSLQSLVSLDKLIQNYQTVNLDCFLLQGLLLITSLKEMEMSSLLSFMQNQVSIPYRLQNQCARKRVLHFPQALPPSPILKRKITIFLFQLEKIQPMLLIKI